MDVFEWIGTGAGPLNGDRFVIGAVLFSHSQIKCVLQDSFQVPGAIVFMLTLPATQHSHPRCCVLCFSVFNCSLVLSCISSSESRGILDSSGARKLLLLYFFHIVVSAGTCAARLLSRLVGWLDCRLDQLYCFTGIIIIIIIIIITIFITIIFKAFKINRSFFVSIDNRSNL